MIPSAQGETPQRKQRQYSARNRLANCCCDEGPLSLCQCERHVICRGVSAGHGYIYDIARKLFRRPLSAAPRHVMLLEAGGCKHWGILGDSAPKRRLSSKVSCCATA